MNKINPVNIKITSLIDNKYGPMNNLNLLQ